MRAGRRRGWRMLIAVVIVAGWVALATWQDRGDGDARHA
jgi:hypothetical protein